MDFDFRRQYVEKVAGPSARRDSGLFQISHAAEDGYPDRDSSARSQVAGERRAAILDPVLFTIEQGLRANEARDVQADRMVNSTLRNNTRPSHTTRDFRHAPEGNESFCFGKQRLILADCIEWLVVAPRNSISAVVTDPPYGLIEYSIEQQKKLRAGRGGVWRIPPSFDGSKRKALPRFTVLSNLERAAITTYFKLWGEALLPVLRPGGHVLIAGNALVSPLVSCAMEMAGYERRGEIVRLVRTFRGGDKPKGAEEEFPMISTMPRSCWEPWGIYRKPIDTKTIAANLRKWGVGGFRRISEDTPFLDVIESATTPDRERALAPHPSVKPQAFLRQIVDAILPLGDGIVLDTFAGCATTLAACEARGINGIGIERDPHYFAMASAAIPQLAGLAI
jgi:DNA modification methylase